MEALGLFDIPGSFLDLLSQRRIHVLGFLGFWSCHALERSNKQLNLSNRILELHDELSEPGKGY